MKRDPRTKADHSGRLRGGLRHVRGAALEVVKRYWEARPSYLGRIYWAVCEALIGSAIGILFAMLYLRSQ